MDGQMESEFWMMESMFWEAQAISNMMNCESSNSVTYADSYLDFPQGWSLFGYTCYEGTDVIGSLSGISSDIVIVKDERGMSYLPEFGFDGIGEFSYGEGYQIKLYNEVVNFQFCPQITSE